MTTLFPVDADSVAITSDDCYTPRWVFDAMGLLISCDFSRPDGKSVRLRQQVFVAFRGVGSGAAERLASSDRYGAVLYGRSAA